MFILDREALDFDNLSLRGKSLLYSVDLNIKMQKLGLQAEGKVRFGPFKSSVQLETSWNADHIFLAHKLSVPDRNYYQYYSLEDEKLYWVENSNKENAPIIMSQKNWLDPLSLVIQFRHWIRNHSVPNQCTTISKNRTKTFKIVSKSNEFQLVRKRKD